MRDLGLSVSLERVHVGLLGETERVPESHRRQCSRHRLEREGVDGCRRAAGGSNRGEGGGGADECEGGDRLHDDVVSCCNERVINRIYENVECPERSGGVVVGGVDCCVGCVGASICALFQFATRFLSLSITESVGKSRTKRINLAINRLSRPRIVLIRLWELWTMVDRGFTHLPPGMSAWSTAQHSFVGAAVKSMTRLCAVSSQTLFGNL